MKDEDLFFDRVYSDMFDEEEDYKTAEQRKNEFEKEKAEDDADFERRCNK